MWSGTSYCPSPMPWSSHLGMRLSKWVMEDLCDLCFPNPQTLDTPTPILTHIFLEQLLSIFGEEVGKAVCLTDLGLQVGKEWDWGVSLGVFWWERGVRMRAAREPLLLDHCSPGQGKREGALPSWTETLLWILQCSEECSISTEEKWGSISLSSSCSMWNVFPVFMSLLKSC